MTLCDEGGKSEGDGFNASRRAYVPQFGSSAALLPSTPNLNLPLRAPELAIPRRTSLAVPTQIRGSGR